MTAPSRSWLPAIVVGLVLVLLAGSATAVTVFAHGRHLTFDDVLHLRTHHGPGIYPDDVRDSYAAACKAQTGGDTSICGCVYNKIAERYTLKEFARIEASMATGIPEEVRAMLADCRLSAG